MNDFVWKDYGVQTYKTGKKSWTGEYVVFTKNLLFK
jgi:hypothetical protein